MASKIARGPRGPREYKTEGGKMWRMHFEEAVAKQRAYKEGHIGPGLGYRVVQSGKHAGKVVPESRYQKPDEEQRLERNARARERRLIKKELKSLPKF